MIRNVKEKRIYRNDLKNRKFSKSAPQILTHPQDSREAGLCLKDRPDGAGSKSADAGDEKTDSSSYFGIEFLWSRIHEYYKR